MDSKRPVWKQLPVETLCSRITSGGTPLRSNRAFYEGGSIRWVKTGELKDWYIEDTEEKITEGAIRASSAKLLPRETVLMAMYGDGRTITSLGVLRHEGACNQACCAMIADPSICSPLFLFYGLKAQRRALIKLAYGGAQRNLNAKTIRQFDIPVPPRPIQDGITAILSAYDDLIENNTRRIKILEQMAQMIYREWFINFRFPGHEKVKMVESELGRIPFGWHTGRLDEAIVLQRGFDLPTAQRTPGPVPIIAATGINGTHNERKVKGPGVVTGRSGSLGTVMFVWEDFWPLNTTLWVKEFPRSTPIHAYFLVKGLDFQTFNSGAAVPTLNRNDVHGLPVVLPHRSVLSQFDDHALPLFALKRNLESKNLNLRTTRDLLLPKLISGEISVEGNDSKTVAQPA